MALRHLAGLQNHVKMTGTCKYSCKKTIGCCLRAIVNIRVILKTFYATSLRCLQGILLRVRREYCSSSYFFFSQCRLLLMQDVFFSSLFALLMQPLLNQSLVIAIFVRIEVIKEKCNISGIFIK